jgi:hypothetical protein
MPGNIPPGGRAVAIGNKKSARSALWTDFSGQILPVCRRFSSHELRSYGTEANHSELTACKVIV